MNGTYGKTITGRLPGASSFLAQLSAALVGIAFIGSAAHAATSASSAAPPRDLSGLWVHEAGPIVMTALAPDTMMDWVAADVKRHQQAMAAGKPLRSNIARCLPAGMPGFLSDAHGIQILQTSTEIVFLGEQDHGVRQVFMNQPHPANLQATWNGHSVGHWEKDVLVIDTVALNDKGTFDGTAPHSLALHLTERWQFVDHGILEVRVTAEDPLALKKPWTFTKRFQKDDEPHIFEYACAENNRD